MQVKNIQQVDFSNKKVFLRADFNVTLENGDIREKYKFESIKETLEHILLFEGSKVAIVSHLGRPEGWDERFSLGQVVDDVYRTLGHKVTFISDCIGSEVSEKLKTATSEQRIFLLENVRFHKGEKENTDKFAQQLAQPFDIYVNDAFSVCHRDQASVTGVAQKLPSYAGIHLQKELAELARTKNTPEHPAVAIIGGAKIQTKLPLIKAFEENYDTILVGGKVANEALDEGIQFSQKVHLPVDFKGERYDIGEKTVEEFSRYIQTAKTIVWNGPMGKFEEEEFSFGTNNIARAIAQSEAYSLAGGGESVEILENLDLMNDFSFVSTGGGAMLEYLSGGEMPGLKALQV